MSETTPTTKRQKTTSHGLTTKQTEEVPAEIQWAGHKVVFSEEVVVKIYEDALKGGVGHLPSSRQWATMGVPQYLERFLWPTFDAEKSNESHVLSIIVLLNLKLSERGDPWPYLQTRPESFVALFDRILDVDVWKLSPSERISYITFLTHCFQSLENEMIRHQVLKLVSLPLWYNLSDGRFKIELKRQPSLVKRWAKLIKRRGSDIQAMSSGVRREAVFLFELIRLFSCLFSLEATPEDGRDPLETTFCEQFLAFLTDLLSQLPTRRFIRVLLQQQGVAVKCRLSTLHALPEAAALREHLVLFAFYMEFNIDEHSGEPFSEDERVSLHYERLTHLQRRIFHDWDTLLHAYAMMDCATLQKRQTLTKLIESISDEDVRELVVNQLKLVSEKDVEWIEKSRYLREVFISYYEKRQIEKEQIQGMALFPTETSLWDSGRMPEPGTAMETVALPLPKLNLQFLSLRDYLWRNFEIYRLEAAYGIQKDLTDALDRVGARMSDEGEVILKGWARMATKIVSFRIIEVKKPLLGYDKPAAVKAEIVFSTKSMRSDVQSEWDALKQHDVVFLLELKPPSGDMMPTENPKELHGVVRVRGCEIVEIKDETGNYMNDFTGRVPFHDRRPPTGTTRTLLVALDAAQYHSDIINGITDPSFALLVRRRPKENNFKAILECMRDLMTHPPTEIDWLQDVFLGYGHPAAAHYSQLPPPHHLVLDMKDTFVDIDHIRESFPEYEVRFSDLTPVPPFRCAFSSLPGTETKDTKTIAVESRPSSYPNPFPQEQPRTNSIRFTPVQIQAMVSGLQKGLTMVVGPPGTGKTDTVVQVLQLLFHNYPNERTLLITHSNHALNDLFQKLMQRDVPARYLLRLGIGEQELETDLDFSRLGRVEAMLARRITHLEEVQRLAKILNLSEDLAYSCETAGHFWRLHVVTRWETFLTDCHGSDGAAISIQERFPFTEFFAAAPSPLFKGTSFKEDMNIATGCFRYLRNLFQELEECRAFELLKTQSDRINYLLTRQAKIVAMTCTHAALRRREFLRIRFQYDTVVMEESAQATEIETFIPWTLQSSDDGTSRLKRIILIGDHHQLPPVIQNPILQTACRMDQSLFSRLIRLRVPFLQLDAQGRCRSSIAQLFNWRYTDLKNLPFIDTDPSMRTSNPGFAWEYQFIDVIDPDGIGESTPTPYFYQNLAEAEYVVRVFQYMRLLGYPASKISILTTYNGQKHLIRDVLTKRCQSHPAFGLPYKVATVDKYQGQQNDYVLLSLVRTRGIGHIRDIRRLVVATSRARLGLYIFGNGALLRNEIPSVFDQWSERPVELSLVKGEAYEHCSRLIEATVETISISGLEEMNGLTQQMTREWEIQSAAAATEQSQ